jgi:uncharacterized protein YecT (DUF1311 family)
MDKINNDIVTALGILRENWRMQESGSNWTERAMNRVKVMSAGIVFLFAAQLYAQNNPGQNDGVCTLAAKLPNPPADLPPTGTPSCDAWGIYYGIDQPTDMKRARYCAYLNLNADESAQDSIQAPAVLAMIYAGGQGVPPNLHLAIKFACQIKGGWDDGSELVNILEAKLKQGAARVDLDVCDNPTGRQMSYACLLRDQARVENDIAVAEKRFNSRSNQVEREEFQNLVKVRRGFLDFHDHEEQSSSQAHMSEDIDTERNWARLLNDLADGKLPHYTEAEFKRADAALNDKYKDARDQTAGCGGLGCTSSDSILQAERAWLLYREAWVSYGKLRWPLIPPDSWRALLTIERTKMLQDIE